MKHRIFLSLLIMSACILLQAEEGMWLPIYLDSLNIEDMHAKGLLLDARDIYDTSHTGLTDAVVIFGQGCTGAVISDKGLVITNHHCGLGYVQSHSSVDNDYITDGFWAKTMTEELPNPGLTVSFLRSIENVTSLALEGVSQDMNESVRSQIIQANIMSVKDSIGNRGGYKTEIKPFFYGNEYFLFKYEVFPDVRLVGAPPSSIGKFGGDTDNWVWPRHTGDFSLFRIYAGKDNRPAPWSPDNVPYRPSVHLPVSLKGVQDGDFTMVCGYPGSTFRFLTSSELKLITEKSTPAMIRARSERMRIMLEAMDADPAVRIKYTAKYAQVTNSLKKWIGMLKGLERTGALEHKKETENEFREWVQKDSLRTQEYGSVLPGIDTLCGQMQNLILAHDYETEVIMSVELFSFLSRLAYIINDECNQHETKAQATEITSRSKILIRDFLKDYYEPVDRRIFAAMMKHYREDLPAEFQPEMLLTLEKEFKGDYDRMADYIYDKTVILKKDKLTSLLNNPCDKIIRKLLKDPACRLYSQFMKRMFIADQYYNQINKGLENDYRLYVRALTEMEKERHFYPDANFTMRISYGNVAGFDPMDAVHYQSYTTLQGIMEKENPEVYDYQVPEKLKELYLHKDYGRYALNDTMRVCFIARNHTSGGNSGSPVLNANGELVGLNFDRNWEGTMSDYFYDPGQCRNISLDIRYALFIIDKYAGAGNLVDEMTIVH